MAIDARHPGAGPAVRRPASPPAWLGFLFVGSVLGATYFVLPEGLQSAIFLAGPLAAMVLALRVVRRSGASARAVWLAVAAALALAAISDVIYLAYPLTTGKEAPFPSSMDVVWLASYPCYLLALWALARQQRDADRPGNLLDAAIIAVNGFILVWVFVLDPVIDDQGMSLAARLVASAYPMMDVVLFAALVRFVISTRTTVVMRLLVAALVSMLLGDIGYVVQTTNGTFANWGPSDAFWILSTLLIGASALHPQAGDLATAARPSDHRLTPRRVLLLGLALLVGPATLSQQPNDIVFLAAMSSLAFVLVMARMWLLSHNLVRARLAVERTSNLLHHQALHDALTGLPNRTLLLDRIDHLQARARRSSATCVVLLIDIDGFKAINDALGHDVGDRLLVALGERLRAGLPDVHTIGRLGGDEFVVLVEGDAMAGVPELVAERILELTRQPFELDADIAPMVVTASIGIAIGPHGNSGELLREADVALYEAKSAGRNGYQQFCPEMEATIQRRYELEADLRSALLRDEFVLLYQPILDLTDLRVSGFEALLRWRHPTKGMVGPNEFIPLLESSGLIVDVGRWVLRSACGQAARWRAAGWDISISVNVSARQLDRDSIVEHVADALRESRLVPAALTLEITETALMNNVEETGRRLRELKALGLRIAIDDFGTGYSSLAYLQKFPVDCLKIDRTFTNDIGRSAESDSMIRTFVQLGKGLGLETLAEGVETPGQLAQLRVAGVDTVQGFLFAKPLPVGAAEELLRTPLATPAGAGAVEART